jgi:hypothetical protein
MKIPGPYSKGENMNNLAAVGCFALQLGQNDKHTKDVNL